MSKSMDEMRWFDKWMARLEDGRRIVEAMG